jgi:hypothetical protein
VGSTSGTPAAPDVTVLVPMNSLAFISSQTGAVLSTLVIDGQGTASTGAIRIIAGSLTIQDLKVKRMNNCQGIRVEGGSLDIAHGVTVTGFLGTNSVGLSLAGTSTASISGTVSRPTVFSTNGGLAIQIAQASVLTISGVPNGLTDGTVVVKNNYYSLFFGQNPAPGLGQNVIDGLVSINSTAGHGMHVISGTNIKIRNSVFLGNAQQGLRVDGNLGPGANDDISLIDIGRAGSLGKNVFQDASNPNQVGGICVTVNQTNAMDAGVPQTLSAEGNIFSGHDCSTGSTMIMSGSCGSADVGVTVAGNKVDVASCTCSTPSICQ